MTSTAAPRTPMTDSPMMATEPPPANASSLTLSGVTMRFGDKTVLDGVNLAVSPGQFVALVGPSGAGKSTLLRLINGIHRPSAGTISVLGVNPATCSSAELRRLRARTGFVFQQFGLVGRLSAMENVLMGALGSLRMPRYGVATYPKPLRARAVEQLERVGLADLRYQRSDTLSGGQQQRVAIARTLMQDAELVLADEPVASLDPNASVSVLQTLRKLSAEDGFTVVCSLHQVELAFDVSDRIVAVRDGSFVLDAPTVEITEADVRAVYAQVTGA